MADAQAKKFLGALWADSGDRTDPDATTLSPPLNRAEGWPSTFSAPDGNKIRRRVFNQRLRSLQGAASDHLTLGIGPYDANIDYPQNALVSAGATTYRALVANGPSTTAVAPTAENQTTWETQAGTPEEPAKPDRPTGATGNGRIEWSWSCPLDGGAVITGFTFQHRRAGAAGWNTESPTVTFFEHAGLVNGATYEARVRATNSEGSGEWSDIGTAVPTAGVPSRVVGLVAISGSDGYVDTRWSEPSGNGGEVTEYIVQWRDSGQSFSSSRERIVTAAAYRITGLRNGVAQFVRVRAVSLVGQGQWSATVAGTPAAPPPPPDPIPENTEPAQVPSAPTGTAIGVTGIVWQWPIPLAGTGREQEGGQRITSFDFQWRIRGNNWSGNTSSTASSCAYVSGLTSGRVYEARARALNAEGPGAWSATGALALSVAGVQNFAGVGTGTSVAWTWSAVDGATGYRLETRQGSGSWTAVTRTASQRSATTTGHTAGTAVQGRVRAVVGSATGSWSNVTAAIVPSAPSRPAGTVAGLDVTFTWSAPSGTGGAAITNYAFRWREVGTSAWTTLANANTRSRTVTVSGPGRFEAEARAINSAGAGPWSGASTTPATVGVDSVQGFSGTGTGTSVAWSWSAVTGATGYRLETRQGSAGWSGANLGATVLARNTTGHAAGTAVQGRVRAVAGSLTGGYVTATATIIPATPAAPVGTVSGLDITWSWSAPANGGGAITGYTLRYRRTGADSWTEISTTSRSRTITGTGGDYEAQVRATNAAGDTPFSASGRASISVGAPSSLTGTGSGTSVNWSWSAVANATDYQLATRQGSGAWAQQTVDGRSETTTGHAAGTAVQGRVRARIGTVTGAWREATAAIVPAAPSRPGLTSAAIGMVTATWSAPANGGAAITSYDLRYRTPGGRWTNITGRSGTSHTFSRTARTEVQARAVNSVGAGPWSTSSAAVTPLALPGPVTITQSTTWAWPWSHVSKATVSVRGADGGGGGGGGGGGSGDNSAFGRNGSSGGDGGDSTLTIAGTTYRGSGGDGGGGGGRGSPGVWGQFVRSQSASNTGAVPGAAGSPGFSGRAGGDGGGGPGGARGTGSASRTDQNRLHSDFSGIEYSTRIGGRGGSGGAGGAGGSGGSGSTNVTGQTTASSWSIVIGGVGTGGAGGAGASGAGKGGDGGPGSAAGRVVITPTE